MAEVETMTNANRAGLLEAVFESLSQKPIPRIPFETALVSWLEECHQTRAGKTVSRYESIAGHLRRFWNVTPESPLLSGVTPTDVSAYLSHRRGTLSAGSANIERKVLATFFNRCVKHGLMEKSPVALTKPFIAKRGESNGRRAFTLEEVKLLFNAAEEDFWRYMILGGFYTGARLGDLICLRHGNVHLRERLLRFTASKTGRTMTIPLAAPLESMLARVVAEAGRVKGDDYIWPAQAESYHAKGSGAFSNEFHNIMAAAGIVSARTHKQKTKSGRAAKRETAAVSFHCLRHTFVSILKLTGGGAAVAKELAGHSSDLVSDLYTHVPEDVLRSAIKSLPEVTV